VDRIAIMCHKAGFLAIFDYAAACPYVPMNMNGYTDLNPETFMKLPPEEEKLAYKDALLISPHKFIGGPGSSGVLIAKRDILNSLFPHRLGGGTVFFVNELEHEFIPDKQDREESGTPGILQDVRAGLVFQLKESVGCDIIQ